MCVGAVAVGVRSTSEPAKDLLMCSLSRSERCVLRAISVLVLLLSNHSHVFRFLNLQTKGIAGQGQAKVLAGGREHSSHLTMGTGGDLGGTALPPLLIIGGVKKHPNRVDLVAANDAWKGIHIGFNEKGSMTKEIFAAYMDILIKERNVSRWM